MTEFHKSSRNKDGYAHNCRTCASNISKAYRTENPEKFKASKKLYYDKNIVRIREEKRNNSKKFTDKKAIYDKEYRIIKQKEIAEFKKNWEREQVKKSPSYKIKRNLRRRIHHALNGKNKSKKTFELLGCDIDFFKKYIENKFTEGMCWENYGVKGWHIDHIIPCAKFDLNIPEEQQKCFHYSNQQPLWATDNYKKGRK